MVGEFAEFGLKSSGGIKFGGKIMGWDKYGGILEKTATLSLFYSYFNVYIFY